MTGPKFTMEKRQRYLGCLATGMRRGDAARCAGVSRWTAQRYAREHPEFQEEVARAEEIACDAIEQSLRNTALSGNVTAMIFYLCNRCPSRWQRDRRPTPDTTANGAVSDLQTIALEKILARLEKETGERQRS